MIRTLVVSIVACAAMQVARAQSSTTGAVQGVVSDAKTGEGLAGVTVVATSAGSATQTALTDEALRRFVDEARAVNRIRHPGIVDIFDFGKLDDGRDKGPVTCVSDHRENERVERLQELATVMLRRDAISSS